MGVGQRLATNAPPHPSGDKRFKMLDATLQRHQYRQDALIEVLHRAQALFGYLDEPLLLYVAHSLKLPPSQVYGVATFYHFFSLKPQGAHSCVVCMGTACYVKGAAELLDKLEEHFGIRAGEINARGDLSLSVARCLGACGIAPAAVVDNAVAGHQTVAGLLKRVEDCMDHGSN
jgi:bidirectional [NiFe] hydrogenase diaphorase subunit